MSDQPALGDITARYVEAFEQHGLGAGSVMYEAGREQRRFEALCRHIESGDRVLDYGCGLAALLDHFQASGRSVDYVGVDIVDDFVRSNQARHPHAEFRTIADHRSVTDRFDHIVISGTFNLDYFADSDRNLDYVQDAIRHLFDRCDVSLAVDFMTDRVDFRQDGAFHASPEAMVGWAIDSLSRRVRLDQTYLPFEFCITVFADLERGASPSVYRSGI